MALNEKVVSSDAQMMDGQVVNNDAQSANFDQVVGRGDEVSYIFFLNENEMLKYPFF